MLTIQVPTTLGSSGEAGPDASSTYWNASNHDPASLLNLEKWRTPELSQLCLPGDPLVLPLPLDTARAMLRYREELQMYAAVDPENSPGRPVMEAWAWLDRQDQRVRLEWPGSAMRGPWLLAIEALERDLDAAIASRGGAEGCFVKLSVRAPKDAVWSTKRAVEMLRGFTEGEGRGATLSEKILFLRRTAWLGMKVTTGREAVALLLRSERVYADLLQAELFQTQPGKGQFAISVCVSKFFEGIDPNWEFRGFVSKGQRTGLTVYSPWVYTSVMIEHKEAILSVILGLWERATPLVDSSDFSIDFAVTWSERHVYIVEINAFLPPLAGSGLFSMGNKDDVETIANGPFQFRVRETPVTEADFFEERVGKDGTRVTINREPAPKHVMALLRQPLESTSKKTCVCS